MEKQVTAIWPTTRKKEKKRVRRELAFSKNKKGGLSCLLLCRCVCVTGAGDKLLFMMARMDVRNAVVVVSRWYGGIQLGPDRFKHINNVAKEVMYNM